jgi:dihydroxyacetone kinase-like predicted kinase
MRVYLIEMQDDAGTTGYCQKDEAVNMIKRMVERLKTEETLTIMMAEAKLSITAKEISKQDFLALKEGSAA